MPRSVLVNRSGCSLDFRPDTAAPGTPVCMSLLPRKIFQEILPLASTFLIVMFLLQLGVNKMFRFHDPWDFWTHLEQRMDFPKSYSSFSAYLQRLVFIFLRILARQKQLPSSITPPTVHALQPPLELLPGVMPWTKRVPTPIFPRTEGLLNRAGGQVTLGHAAGFGWNTKITEDGRLRLLLTQVQMQQPTGHSLSQML